MHRSRLNERKAPFTTSAQFVPPTLPTRIRELPTKPGWSFELKFDGYRIEAIKDGENVRLFSRRGNDFTKRFARIAQAVRQDPTEVEKERQFIYSVQSCTGLIAPLR